MTRIGAFAIIFNDQGQVLLGHRRDMDVWNLPGGRVEAGERPDKGILREVREETGLTVQVSRLVGIYSKPNQDELIFLFRCVITEGELVQETPETDANHFFPPAALPQRLIPKHRQRILDALAGHPAPIFRTQTGPGTRQFLLTLAED